MLHNGNANPLTEGFTGGPTGVAQVGPVTADQNLDAWSIELNSAQGAAFYTRYLTAGEATNAARIGWSLSARIRIVEVPDNGSGMSVKFFTGSKVFGMGFGAEADGDPFVNVAYPTYVPGQVFILEGTGGGYHHYSLVYDQPTSTVNLWVDGQERLSGLSGVASSAPARIDWGAGQAISHGNWNEVSLKLIQPKLEIVAPTSQQVQLSWSTNYSGYVLESASIFQATVWEMVTNDVVTSGDRCSVLVASTNTSRLFRLRGP